MRRMPGRDGGDLVSRALQGKLINAAVVRSHFDAMFVVIARAESKLDAREAQRPVARGLTLYAYETKDRSRVNLDEGESG